MSRCERRVTTITCIHDSPEPNSNEMNWKPFGSDICINRCGDDSSGIIVTIISFVLLLRRYRSYNVGVSVDYILRLNFPVDK